MIAIERRDWVVAWLYREGDEHQIGVEYRTLEEGIADVKASRPVSWPYRVIFTDYDETQTLYELSSADFEPSGGKSEWSRVLEASASGNILQYASE